MINVIPIQDVKDNASPKRNTPSNVAVNGSANASVTAVEDATCLNPCANKKYASAVATSPKCKLTPRPLGSVIHDISKMNKNGDNIKPLNEKITATTDNDGCT